MPFDYDDFLIAVENLLYPERAFGLRRYFTHPHEAREVRITDIESRRQGWSRQWSSSALPASRPGHIAIRLALEEIVNNPSTTRSDGPTAPKTPDGRVHPTGEGEPCTSSTDATRGNWDQRARELRTLDVGAVLGKIAARLPWRALRHQWTGLYLTRQMSDRMIINLDPGKRGEVVLCSAPQHPAARPLHINVVR